MTAPAKRESEIMLRHNRAEAASAFALARRIPCTDLVQRIRYMETLPPDRLDRLFVEWHRLRTEHADDPSHLFALKKQGQGHDFPEAMAFQTDRESGTGFRRIATMPVKMVANLMKNGGPDALEEWRQLVGLPEDALALWPELAGSHDELKPAKPATIRKALTSLMSARYGAEEGEYLGIKAYGGTIDGLPFMLRAVFAAKGGLPQNQQFDYGLAFGNSIKLSTYPVAYEGMWMARSCWDYITEANLDACMSALADTIDLLHGIYLEAALA